MGDRYAIDYYKAGGRSRACAEDFWIRKEKFTEAYVKLRVEFPWAVADLALVALPWGGFSWVSDPSRPVPEGLKRAHRAGLLCPDRKSERGAALAKAMAKLRKDHPRVHYKHFTADLFGGLIPKVDRDDGSYNVSYGLAIGAGITFGIDLDRVWHVVHASNMAKFEPCSAEGDHGVDCVCKGHRLVAVRDASGKVIKPDGWQKPDIKAEIERQYRNADLPRGERDGTPVNEE